MFMVLCFMLYWTVVVQAQRNYAAYIEEYGDAWNKKWVAFFSNPSLKKSSLHRGLNDVFAVCICCLACVLLWENLTYKY